MAESSRTRTPSAGMEAALLDAAADILQSEGPDGLSVRRIAAAAGVAPMGVYNHFESKFGIIDALFIRGFERLGQAMDSIADISDSYEALRQAGQRYRALALKHPMEYRIMFMQSVPGFEPSDKAMEVAASAFAALVAAVQRAMAAGIIAEGPPTDTAQMIWASIHGWVSLELLDIGFVEDQAAGYDQVCAAMLRGLRPNDDAWAGYLRTEVEFTPPDRAPFTVRPAPPGVVGQWPEGFGSPVRLLTAWDPGRQRPGDTVNRARQAELEDELAQRGLEVCPTAGRVPGSARHEIGVAVWGLTLPDAMAFGTRYGQDAIFEWTPAALSTISCVDARRYDGGWDIAGGT